jgi:hypothetical protein
MDSEELLAQLADIRLPEPVSWWPPAPGWWILSALFLLAAVLVGRRLLAARRRRLILCFALAELDLVTQSFESARNGAGDENPSGDQAVLALVNGINGVLRRVALYHFPSDGVAGLTGDDWVRFLQSKSTRASLDDSVQDAFANARFQRSLTIDSEQLARFARDWITEQYRPEGSA